MFKERIKYIVQSVDATAFEDLPSVSERYFEHKYCMKVDGIESDIHQRLSFHSNRIILLSLAENHPVVKERKEIGRVRWQVDADTDRQKSRATGRRRRDAHKLLADSVLCHVECVDGSTYPVYACLPHGKLIDINDANLEADPSALQLYPTSHGYIALVQPSLHHLQLSPYTAFKDALLTHGQYNTGCWKNPDC